uniref:Actin-related protein 10 n=1 Tax=Amphimedon queenslandica TaxID=400682 RepID=A0A1X7VBD6_AMPQE
MSARVTRTVSSPAGRSLASSRVRGNLVPQDKGAIVLDIGHVHTKLGVSGEPAPRYIVKSEVLMKPYGEILNVWDDKYINREELYLILCRFLHKVFLEYLIINPREYRIVIIESIVSPLNFRNTLAKALFIHFSVPHVCFLPHPSACLFSLGSSTALLIDIGLKETSIVPVFEGVSLIRSIMQTTTSTSSLHSSLQLLLHEHCQVKNIANGDIHPLSDNKDLELTSSTLSNIIMQTCFVRSLDFGDATPPDVCFPINAQFSLIISGLVRCHVADILFEGCDGDVSLPISLVESLLLCPIDCRSQLCENIVVVGGSASLPGLNYRLLEEIRLLCGNSRYQCLDALKFKFHELHSHPNYTAWQGASIIGAVESAILERSITKEDFKLLDYHLPDWMSCNSQNWGSLQQVSPQKIPSSQPGKVIQTIY